LRIVLAHGSSDSIHGDQVRALASRVSALLDEEIGAAFLSDERLPEGAQVLPLFLGSGIHVTEDIPELVRASGCSLLPAIGEHVEAVVEIVCKSKEGKRLFVLYQSDAFEPLADALRTCCEGSSVAVLHGDSSVIDALDRWCEEGVENVTVQPMLLFGGHSLARVQAMIRNPSMPNATLAPVLSEHEGFAELVAECFREQS